MQDQHSDSAPEINFKQLILKKNQQTTTKAPADDLFCILASPVAEDDY